MRFIKKMILVLGLVFLALGLFLFVADFFHIRWYGIDIVSGPEYVTDDGQVATAPVEAGGYTIFDYVPAYIYALACCVISAFAFAFLPLAGKKVSSVVGPIKQI